MSRRSSSSISRISSADMPSGGHCMYFSLSFAISALSTMTYPPVMHHFNMPRNEVEQEHDIWDGIFPLPFHIGLREKHACDCSIVQGISWCCCILDTSVDHIQRMKVFRLAILGKTVGMAFLKDE